MNDGAKVMVCMAGAVGITVLAALLFHPAVFLGAVIGVAVSEIKNIWLEKQ